MSRDFSYLKEYSATSPILFPVEYLSISGDENFKTGTKMRLKRTTISFLLPLLICTLHTLACKNTAVHCLNILFVSLTQLFFHYFSSLNHLIKTSSDSDQIVGLVGSNTVEFARR